MTVKTEQHLEFLSLKGGCTGSSESKCHIVGNHMSRLIYSINGPGSDSTIFGMDPVGVGTAVCLHCFL